MLRAFFTVYIAFLLSINCFSQQASIKILPTDQISYIDSFNFIIVRPENVQNLHAYSITISYNSNLIKYQDLMRLDFFSSLQTFFFPMIDTINGTIKVDEAILGAYSQSGSGDILKIKFKAIAEGTCSLLVNNHVLKDLNNQNINANIENALIQIIPLVSVNDNNLSNEILVEFNIYPNPFNSSTNISVSSRLHKTFYLRIYNVIGQEVYNLTMDLNNEKKTFIWSAVNNYGSRLPSGIYFAKIENGSTHHIRKIVLLK